MEDAALEDAKSQMMMAGISPNDPNFEEMRRKVMVLRNFSEQQAQGKLLFDQGKASNAIGQSMHHQQIHDFLMKDIPPTG